MKCAPAATVRTHLSQSSPIRTQAWVIRPGDRDGSTCPLGLASIRLEPFEIPPLDDEEVLVEPIYGCWEGNMSHALKRQPIDVCLHRGEERVVLGNAGVVRILGCGPEVSDLKEGDLCALCGGSSWDARRLPRRAFGYDAQSSCGLLAKRTKLHRTNLFPLPADTRHSLRQWAAFSLRYVTAWANWKAASGCLSAVAPDFRDSTPWAGSWGGGVGLAEMELARLKGFDAFMIASCDARLAQIAERGIVPIDRRLFAGLRFDEAQYRQEERYRRKYREAEAAFLHAIAEATGGQGASVFVENIGQPVVRATLKALSRPGVLATCGWKMGMRITSLRALECMSWHVHVHTHYARRQDGLEAVRFAEEKAWLPRLDSPVWNWDSIPELAGKHALEELEEYFPIYQVNPL